VCCGLSLRLHYCFGRTPLGLARIDVTVRCHTCFSSHISGAAVFAAQSPGCAHCSTSSAHLG
jgi:hypothetical protein